MKRADRDLSWALGLLVLMAVLLLLEPLAALPHRVATFQEGWNAQWARAAALRQPLYRPPESWAVNNYPPLSFLLLGCFPDPLVAGRALALVSLLALGALVGRSVVLMGGEVGPAGVAGTLLVTFLAVHNHSYMAVDDPQFPGQVLATAGLVVLLTGPAQAPRLVMASLLMFLGGLFKPIFLPLPVAVTFWLRGRPRKIWLLSGALLLSLGALGADRLYGQNFFSSLNSPRRWCWAEAASLAWLPAVLPMLVVVGPFLYRARQESAARLIGLYALAAGFWGLFLGGVPGLDRNRLFDLYEALCLGSGLLLSRCRYRPAYLGALLLTCVVALPFQAARALREWHALGSLEDDSARDIAWLQGVRGDVAVENHSLAYWSGHNLVLEVALTGEKFKRGSLDPAVLEQAFRSHRFQVVQVPGEEGFQAFPESVNRTLFQAYRVARRSPNGLFLVPRSPQALPQPPSPSQDVQPPDQAPGQENPGIPTQRNP